MKFVEQPARGLIGEGRMEKEENVIWKDRKAMLVL